MSANGWTNWMKTSRQQQLKSKPKPKPKQRSSNPKKRKLNPNSKNNNHTPTPKKRKLSNIEHVQCPMCSKNILSRLIKFHIEEHFLDKNKNKTKNKNTNNNNSNKIAPAESPINNTNSNSNNNNNNKICPLFTNGALPSKMFTKTKKRNNNTIPSQTAIFYVGIMTDNSDTNITQWNAEWIDNASEIKAFLLKSKEMNYFITNVFIKEPNTNKQTTKIYLITNYASNKQQINVISNEFAFNYPSPNSYRFSPSLTKSLLQKCVRVSFEKAAVKAAYLLLLKDNLTSLLRRLSIIVIEDVILMKDYILLIWLLAAESKSDINQKYYPKMCFYNWIFSLVKKCALYKVKDYMDFELHPNEDKYINLFTPLANDETEDDNKIKQLLIRSMLIRASYGGMKCDVAMLRSYACIWHNRLFGQTKHCKYYNSQLEKLIISNDIQNEIFENNSNNASEIQNILNNNNWLLFMDKLEDKYCKNSMVEMKEILAICSNDLILSAVDFHCSDMLNVLCNKNNGKCYGIINEYLNGHYSVIYNNDNHKWKNNIEGLVKLIIWEFRSSQTNKIGLLMNEEKPIELFELWTKIRPIVNDFSLTHFKYRTNR